MQITKHIMIDTETLALSPRALVWEFAAVEFLWEQDGTTVRMTPADKLHGYVIHADSSKFDVQLDTLRWTRGVQPERLEYYLDGVSLTGCITVDEIHDFFGKRTGHMIWARNGAFDFPILEHMFKASGFKMPWHRRFQNCLYTKINDARRFDPEYELSAPFHRHTALADARAQIIELADAEATVAAGYKVRFAAEETGE